MPALLALAFALLPGIAAAPGADARRSSDQPQGLRSNVPAVYALVGGDVVVRPGEVVQGATLVVRDGKIAAVGKDAAVPADATVIDVSGKRLYAGFIDAYAELPAEQTAKDATLSARDAANYWNPNVTPQADAARILAIDPKTHEALRKLGFVARVYAPSAGVVKGRLALVTTADGAAGDTAMLKNNVGLAAQLVPAGRGRGGGYPSSPMGAFALVRQALYDAQWYAAARAAVEKDAALPLPERNDALAALKPIIDGEMPVWFVSRDEKYALRAKKIADEFSLQAVNVASGFEYRRGQLVADTKLPMVLPLELPQATRRQHARAGGRGDAGVADAVGPGRRQPAADARFGRHVRADAERPQARARRAAVLGEPEEEHRPRLAGRRGAGGADQRRGENRGRGRFARHAGSRQARQLRRRRRRPVRHEGQGEGAGDVGERRARRGGTRPGGRASPGRGRWAAWS